MRLPGWDEAGQRRLAQSHAVIVGTGALGCGVADQLARAGVGHLTLIDRDIVETSNLHRQTLFSEADIGVPKAEAARRRLAAVNSTIEIAPAIAHLDAANIGRVARDADVIVDGTDNFETRYLINDYAVKHAVPYVYGGAVGTRGMAMNVLAGLAGFESMPCLRCLFPEPPPPGSQPTCETAGVLGPLISIVSGVQAAEAIKILLGQMDRVARTLLEFDLWEGVRRRVNLENARDPACVCCGQRRFEFLEAQEAPAVSLCGQDAVQISGGPAGEINLAAIEAASKHAGHAIERTPFFLRLTPSEDGLSLTVFPDGRAIVHGTADPGRAQAAYDRYVGR